VVNEALAAITNYRLALEEVTSLKQASRVLRSNSFDGIIPRLTGCRTPRASRLWRRCARFRLKPPCIVLTGLDAARLAAKRLSNLALQFQQERVASTVAAQRTLDAAPQARRGAASSVRAARQIDPGRGDRTDRAAVIRFVNDAALELSGSAKDLWRTVRLRGQGGVGGGPRNPALAGEPVCEVRVAACEWNEVPASLVLVRDMTDETADEQLQHARRWSGRPDGGGIAMTSTTVMWCAGLPNAAGGLRRRRSTIASIVEIVQSIERAHGLTAAVAGVLAQAGERGVGRHMGEVVTGIHSMLPPHAVRQHEM